MGRSTRACATILLLATLSSACSEEALPPLLFQATLRGDSEDIYALILATGATQRITLGSREYANSFPTWSPNRDRIAFVRQSDADTLYLLHPATSSTRFVTITDLPVLGPPAWSPDGTSILIAAGPDLQRRRLYVVDLAADEFAEVPMPEGMFDCGSYSPDGSRIVASRRIGSTSELVIADPKGGMQRALLTSDSLMFHCPEWSPADPVIVVAAYSTDYERSTLWLVDLSSGIFNELSAGAGYNNAPKWSPDGSVIAFQCTDSTPQDTHFYDRMEICVVRRDGSSRLQLTDNNHFDAHPSW